MRIPMLGAALLSGLVLATATASAFAGSGRKPEPWNATFTLGLRHDDNVPLASGSNPFAGETESYALSMGLNLSTRLHRGPVWTIGVGLGLSTTRQSERDLKAYDHGSISPRIYAQRRVELFGVPAGWHLGYGYRRDGLGSGLDLYEERHTVFTGLNIPHGPQLSSTLNASWSRKDFSFEGANPPVTSRDGKQLSLSAGQKYRFGLGQVLSYGLSLSEMNAEGLNFDTRSHGANIGLFSPLPIMFQTADAPWNISLSASYTDKDYTEFTQQPRRQNDVWSYGISLGFPVTEKLSTSVAWSFTEYDDDGNPQFEAKRNRPSFGLSYRW